MTATDLLGSPRSVDGQGHRTALRWWTVYLAALLYALIVAALAYVRSNQPYLGVSAAALGVLVTMWFARPRATLALTLALTLVSDIVTASWFPFTKNLSSVESILYIADSISLSPLEISLVVGLIATALRRAATGERIVPRRRLDTPILVFTGFLAIGFGRGVGSGSDLRIALIEGRSLFYLLLVYVLVGMVCRTRHDLNVLLGVGVVGVLAQSLLSLHFYLSLAPGVRHRLESLTEHGSAVALALVLATLLASCAYAGVPGRIRLALAAAALPIGFVFLVSQRRAALISLVAALIALSISLFWRQPRTFAKFVPSAVVVGVGYFLAFRNSTSSLGFPAQAIKGVFSPDSLSAADRNSNAYRVIETYDLWYTIRSAPLFGLGFGRAFLRPIPLPDLSFFELNAYLPHNSILWLWIKVGFFGFATMFYIVARALHCGSRTLRALPNGTDALVAMTAVMFVLMYVVYTYVDVSWDARNMVLLAVMLSICVFDDPVDSDPHALAIFDVGAGDEANDPRITPRAGA